MTENPIQPSRQLKESLLSLAVVEEIIRADGWDSLDDCFEIGGDTLVDRYIGMADAAIHACRSYLSNSIQ